MGSINNLSSNLFQTSLLKGTNLVGNTTSLTDTASASQSDNNQLSPLAKVLSELQQLQQSDPAKYQSVMKQIATNLQTAAQADTAKGNTAGAAQLTQLSKDFTKAATSRQMPDIQDLAQAVQGAGHHRHHHGHSAPPPATDSDDASSASGASAGSSAANSGQTLSQLLAAYQTSSGQGSSTPGSATNALSIVMNTLSSAGIGTSAA